MILATIRMIISPKKRGEALKILRSIAEQCKVQSGCLGCHIYEDVQEDNVLMFEDIWRSEEDLERHLRSKEYRYMLLVMEMALKRPEVRFNTVLNSKGSRRSKKQEAPPSKERSPKWRDRVRRGPVQEEKDA
jgi:quinol monooxygenase YgiN